uniref:CS domain-containing protein n=1 Tax=Fundulus heteroclitus TaxID=8078 RepID=A0A3Q2PAK0_FUNHE
PSVHVASSDTVTSNNLPWQNTKRQKRQGRLFDVTVSDEATWTLEDKCLIRIVLMKTNREAGNCWSSLLEGEYCANAWVQDQMQRKLTLERFQREVSWTRALRAARTA